jgi:hypothetical protein
LFIKDLSNAKKDGRFVFPGFNLKTMDPEENKFSYNRQTHEIILVEGPHLLLDEAPWKSFKYDKTYFLDTPVRKTYQRLQDKLKFLMGLGRKEAKERLQTNELSNTDYILKNSKVDQRYQAPQNMGEEFTAILKYFCDHEKVEMPKNHLAYLHKCMEIVEIEALGPQKDWSGFNIIDTGSNLQNFSFENDLQQVFQKAKKFGVQKVIFTPTSI